ncbi:MAG: 5-methylthioadenosine/S-adenosylhomocysteine deaminase [Anaerolineae bacterium]|nr:MAG: 5-methylthioadenosine/S-adenosylhomocysteine deaminase [Anaerolineae bacterium]
MKRILIKGADIVTLDEASTILRNADLLIEGKYIAQIGHLPPDTQADEIIDTAGQVALPGFFNAHCHAPMTFERGWAEDLPFPRWLNEKIWVAESALTPEDVYWGAALAACEMLRSGTVAFNDHYFYMDRVAQVVLESGMKAMLTWCTFGIGDDKEIGPGAAAQLAFSRDWQGAADGRIHTCLGPHSPYICPPEFLRRIVELAEQYQLPIHLHVAESQEQVTNSQARYGQTPVEQLATLGVFDHPTVAAHCLALTPDDRALLAEKPVTIVRTPITYMKLAMPIHVSLTDLQAAGITRVALGSDGPASNAVMDMWDIVRQTVWLEKYQTQNPEAVPGDTALRMATRNGALAMGFAQSGVLAEGMAADLMLVDMDRPHLRPRHDLIANLVHAARGADVTHVLVDGQVLMRDRQLLTLDEERILYEAERRALRMVRQNMNQVREYRG